MTADSGTWAGPGPPVAKHFSHVKEALGVHKWPGALPAGWAHRAWGSSSCRRVGRQGTDVLPAWPGSSRTHPSFPETHTAGRQDTWEGAFSIPLTILVIQTIIRFSLKNPPLFVSVVKQKGCSHENLFLHFQIIPGPHIGYNTPVKFILWPWATRSTAQPEGQAACVAQSSTARSLLCGPTQYIALLVRITAEVFENHHFTIVKPLTIWFVNLNLDDWIDYLRDTLFIILDFVL